MLGLFLETSIHGNLKSAGKTTNKVIIKSPNPGVNQPSTNAGVTHTPQSAEETQKSALASAESQNKGAARAEGTPALPKPLGWEGTSAQGHSQHPEQPGNPCPQSTAAPSLSLPLFLHKQNEFIFQFSSQAALPGLDGSREDSRNH